MARVEIEVVIGSSASFTRYALETFDDAPIPLTYQITDIENIDKVASSYSKTIELPDSDYNRIAFGFISDLNISSSDGVPKQQYNGGLTNIINLQSRSSSQQMGAENPYSHFNPNKKARCYVLCDSHIVLEGYLQLTGVIKNKGTNKNTLQCVIYADNDNLWTKIGLNFLTDIDFSNLNHDWTTSNIESSWASNADNSGYFYPMIDYGDTGLINGQPGGDWTLKDIGGAGGTQPPVGPYQFKALCPENLFPATYVKTIWDRIFQAAGYSYNSKFLNSNKFKNLVIPFNNGLMSRQIRYDQSFLFRAGMGYVYCGATSSAQQGSWTMSLVDTGYGTLPYSAGGWMIGGIPGIGNAYGTASNLTYTLGDIGVRIRMADENTPNGDPANTYDTGWFQYTHPGTTASTMRFGVQYSLVEWAPTYGGVSTNNHSNVTAKNGFQIVTSMNQYGVTYSTNTLQLAGALMLDSGDTTHYTSGNVTDLAITPNQLMVIGTTYSVDGTFGHIMTGSFYSDYITVYPGEKVWLNYQRWVDISGAFTTKKPLVTILPSTTFWNEFHPNIIQKEPIDYNSVIPTNVKQQDFILSIVKMFNLLVEPDKNYANTLKIEPRDDYYASGTIQNWDDRVDYNQDIEIQILAETQNKINTFTYTDDKDFYNADYVSKFKKTYGEYQYIIDNDVLINENIIKPIFSPTPLVNIQNSNGFIIPKIVSQNNGIWHKTDSNIRILQRTTAGLLPNQWGEIWRFGYRGYETQATTFSSYPYIGHFDNPYNPDFDLNYGQTKILYYGQNNATNNNLVTNYWQKMLDEYTDIDSRIITLNMYLSPLDMSKFSFANPIFIDNQYYKIMKIDGYDPSKKQTCKVTLIKTLDITVNKPVLTYVPGPGNHGGQIALSQNYTGFGVNGGLITAIGAGRNIILSSGSGVVGVGNTIGPNSEGSFISGLNNSILSNNPSSIIMGNNNVMVDSIHNTVMIGQSIIGAKSNTVYISNFEAVGSGTGSSLGLPNTLAVDGDTGYLPIRGTVSLWNTQADSDSLVILGIDPGNTDFGASNTIQRQRAFSSTSSTPYFIDTVLVKQRTSAIPDSYDQTDVLTIDMNIQCLINNGNTPKVWTCKVLATFTCDFQFDGYTMSTIASAVGPIDYVIKNHNTTIPDNAFQLVPNGTNGVDFVFTGTSDYIYLYADYKLTRMAFPWV